LFEVGRLNLGPFNKVSLQLKGKHPINRPAGNDSGNKTTTKSGFHANLGSIANQFKSNVLTFLGTKPWKSKWNKRPGLNETGNIGNDLFAFQT